MCVCVTGRRSRVGRRRTAGTLFVLSCGSCEEPMLGCVACARAARPVCAVWLSRLRSACWLCRRAASCRHNAHGPCVPALLLGLGRWAMLSQSRCWTRSRSGLCCGLCLCGLWSVSDHCLCVVAVTGLVSRVRWMVAARSVGGCASRRARSVREACSTQRISGGARGVLISQS